MFMYNRYLNVIHYSFRGNYIIGIEAVRLYNYLLNSIKLSEINNNQMQNVLLKKI